MGCSHKQDGEHTYTFLEPHFPPRKDFREKNLFISKCNCCIKKQKAFHENHEL